MEWEDRVKSSPAILKAGELKQLIETIDTTNLTNGEEDYLERAEVVADAVISRLNNCDPRLVNPTALANLSNSMSNAVASFNNWQNTSNFAYINGNLQNELDAAINSIVGLVLAQSLPEAQSAVTSLRRSVSRHRTIVEGVISELESRGSSADVAIDDKLKQATAEFDKLQNQATNLGNDLTAIKSAGAQVSTEQQTAFTKAEADRSTTFNKLVTDKQKELEESLDELETTAKVSAEATRKEIENEKTKAENAKIRIEEILGIVSEGALIGDYSKNAKDEKGDADRWRKITACSLAGAVIAAVIFAFTVSGTTSWQHVLAKTVLVISFGGLAGYSGKQSSEHRTAQREAEQMALQLKALKPYLSDIDNGDERDKLLIKIADRLFGREEPTVINVGKSKSRSSQKNDGQLLTSQLLQVILDLVEQSKHPK